MERQIISTADGSSTVSIPEMKVTYHSTHGAIQESMHVFIDAGLRRALPGKSAVRILEMGFGTGLNALLTLIEAQETAIHYTGIELFPLEPAEVNSLNYCQQLNRMDLQPVFELLHNAGWEKEIAITEIFTLLKTVANLPEFEMLQPGQFFDIIYFDAFAPSAQPELWTGTVFANLFGMLSPGGLLVTYCSKGDVRRAMQSAGFKVEKPPGPPGKREMVRAWKEM